MQVVQFRGYNLVKQIITSEKKRDGSKDLRTDLLNAIWGCSSVGRAPALQAGGREFESLHLHQQPKVANKGKCGRPQNSHQNGLIAQLVRAHA